MTSNQEYLFQRLQTLARDSCVANFNHNGGASFNGQKWNESWPTDADIVLHVFFTYLDQHATSHASYVTENRLKSLFFVPASSLQKMLKDNRKIMLAQISNKPPTFGVVFKDKLLQIPDGNYNVFHSLLLFVFLHDRHNYGKLDTISLGAAGINISWIFSWSISGRWYVWLACVMCTIFVFVKLFVLNGLQFVLKWLSNT